MLKDFEKYNVIAELSSLKNLNTNLSHFLIKLNSDYILEKIKNTLIEIDNNEERCLKHFFTSHANRGICAEWIYGYGGYLFSQQKLVKKITEASFMEFKTGYFFDGVVFHIDVPYPLTLKIDNTFKLFRKLCIFNMFNFGSIIWPQRSPNDPGPTSQVPLASSRHAPSHSTPSLQIK